ncbi:hypothetical protein [Rhodanobacter lindaniclasticus]
MKVMRQLAEVRAAQARMTLARHDVGEPAAALLARGRAWPLTTVGLAAGAGVALGSLDVHPLRVPGLTSLVGGGLAEVLAQGAHLLAEVAAAGVAAHAAVDAAAATEPTPPTTEGASTP